MKEPNWQTCNEKELWEYVAWFLGTKGVSTILVGGAVVSIYTEGAYTSGDLDIVIESFQITHKEIEKLLLEINFIKTGTRNFFKHPECDHILIEFMSPPVSIGEEYQIKPDKFEIDRISIKLLSPTDCIKDRLGSYLYFNARECLDQALLVAKAQPYKIKEVELWCKNEGGKGPDVFKEFKNLLGKNN